MNHKFYYAIAQSDDIYPENAANEIVEICLSQLNGKIPKAGIIYMGINIDHQKVLNIIHHRINGIDLIGCTTDGEFSSEKGYMQDSVLLILFSSTEIDFISGKIDLTGYNVENVKTEIDTMISKIDKQPRIGFLFSDGITLNSENSLEIMNNVFDGKIPFFGGAAADQWLFTGTKQFFGKTVLASSAVYLILCGDFEYSFALGTGWNAIGHYGVINKSERNIVKQIDGIRAIDFYQDLLGEGAIPSIEMPMAIYNKEDSFMYLRTTLQNNVGKDGSITFLGNIPEGYKVRLTLVDRNSILDSVTSAVEKARKLFPPGKKPSIAICFSCTARRALLGLRTDEECRIVQTKLGGEIPVFGFYTYGEFSPPADSSKTIFHNESFVCLLLE